jgi:3' terminal RNA ribose 2'-O-methyltransferase Hen1
MAGTCKGFEELAASAIPLDASLPVVPARGGEPLVRRLFEPLDYGVEVTPIALDPEHPDWGEGRHVGLRLTCERRLAELLNHLYVLLPVLDDDKHYWVDEAEIDKLMRRGEGWLAGHPERDLIVRRYLKKQAGLYHPALAQLDEGDDEPAAEPPEEALEERVSLRDQRLGTVEAVIKASGARRVLDLGCGSGALLRVLEQERSFTEIVGVDVSASALDLAEKRLKDGSRVKLRQSALTYADPALAGYDAAVLMEVVEHVDPPRLPALEYAVFGAARPRTVLVTTPNVEYNVRWESLPAGHVRHGDHRFEWTRKEFRAWAGRVAERHGYTVEFRPVGPDDPEVGPPTQMAVFTLTTTTTVTTTTAKEGKAA